MSEDDVQPVILDATVLSNFASSGTVNQLVVIIDRPVTVPAVREKLTRGRGREHEFLEDALEHLEDDIDVVEVQSSGDGTASEIQDRLDAGEADALISAINEEGILATDDLAARRLASSHGISVTGSVGILVLGIRRDVIDVHSANEWLTTWKETRGYFSPVDRVEEILE